MRCSGSKKLKFQTSSRDFVETNASSIFSSYTRWVSSQENQISSLHRLSNYTSFPSEHRKHNLQGVSEKLVHLGDLGRDRKVDGTVTNLNNESTNDIGVDLVGNLELLALTDVLRLGDGRFEAIQSLVVQLLEERPC
jgi:hypothetical protein